MSSAGCVWAARKYIEEYGCRGEIFGLICYDAAWKYLTWGSSREEICVALGISIDADTTTIAKAIDALRSEH
jgi:hypothetical protein